MFRLVLQCIQRQTITKQDKPGIVRFVRIGTCGPVPAGNGLRKIVGINARPASLAAVVIVDQRQHFIAAGQPPVAKAAELLLVDDLNISVRVAVSLTFAATAIAITGFTVITFCRRIVPGIEIVTIPHTVVISLDLPYETGDAILHTGPLGGVMWKNMAVRYQPSIRKPG